MAAFIGVAATLLLVFFGAYLRGVLRAAAPEGEILSLVSFLGLVVVAVGFAIDSTILIALSEAADDIDPVAVQSLQALWDNDFVPLVLGVLMFLWATGLAVIRTGALPQVARLGDGRARSRRPHADRLRRGHRRCHPRPRAQHPAVGAGPLRTRNWVTLAETRTARSCFARQAGVSKPGQQTIALDDGRRWRARAGTEPHSDFSRGRGARRAIRPGLPWRPRTGPSAPGRTSTNRIPRTSAPMPGRPQGEGRHPRGEPTCHLGTASGALGPVSMARLGEPIRPERDVRGSGRGYARDRPIAL